LALVIGDKGLSQTPAQVEVKRRGEKESAFLELQTAAAELSLKILNELDLYK